MGGADPTLTRLIDRVRGAVAVGAALDLQGGSTKAFFGEPPCGERLAMQELAGISAYEPSELVVTARAGTLLADLEAALAEGGQCLAFEPPRFAPGGTVGGMVAAGLSGPARASAGALRDYVLGATVLNGRAELLCFGGQVMKNVAGYDLSRLFAGSWGVLGVICEVSLKVMPVPVATLTVCLEADQPSSLSALQSFAAKPLPLTASAWYENRLWLRFAGAEAAVRAAGHRLGGTALDPAAAQAWWCSLRDQTLDFFRPDAAALAQGDALWRLSLPPTAPPLELEGRQLIEWHGALRWWRSAAPATALRAAAARVGGHATLVRASAKPDGAFARPGEPALTIQRRLKQSFDPAGIFNPGRLFADL
jgi:FAD/FMN-containing dehydrogenase